MSINLGALAARGQTLFESAVATAGTTVSISRDSDDTDETVDFDTLEVTDPTEPGTVATDVQAIIVSQGAAVDDQGPNRTAHPATYSILLPVSVTDIAEGDVVTVTASRDSLLTDARLLVTDVLDAGIGVLRTVHARRI